MPACVAWTAAALPNYSFPRQHSEEATHGGNGCFNGAARDGIRGIRGSFRQGRAGPFLAGRDVWAAGSEQTAT